ncbi:MAG: hypothetical protein LIP00_08305, partial [Parabacteroides sp.]|nr:hypothetical protein [Parabacteroides sp.]
MQTFVNYIFLEKICQAPKLQGEYPEFTTAMDMPAKYRELLENTSGHLLQPLTIIYREVKTLPPQHIKTLRRALHINQRIRELCTGMHRPVSYDDLRAISPALSNAIDTFCRNLYSRVPALAGFQRSYETLKDYYGILVDRETTCYCCGIHPVSNKYHKRRSPFDHFLPQAIYPFVSLNVHNLVPTCDYCNGEKHEKDTLILGDNGNKERIRAFYPFRYEQPPINISLNIRDGCNLTELEPEDIDLQMECDDHPQEIKNWDRLYDIEGRYKAEYCSTDVTKYYDQYLICKKRGYSYDEITKIYQLNAFGDKNIIKRPL